MKPNKEDLKYIRAKTKVDQIKSFFRNIILYLFASALFIIILLVMKSVGANNTAMGIIKYVATTTWYVWGIIILIHAVLIFGSRLIFGLNWEAKKIEQYMNEDQNETYK